MKLIIHIYLGVFSLNDNQNVNCIHGRYIFAFENEYEYIILLTNLILVTIYNYVPQPEFIVNKFKNSKSITLYLR